MERHNRPIGNGDFYNSIGTKRTSRCSRRTSVVGRRAKSLPTFKMTAFDPTATLASISKSGIPLPFRKTPLIRYDTRVRMRGSMKRREFIKLVCTGVLASPLPASAQKRTNAVIGMLTAVTPNAVQLATIRKGLDERGYVEGRNLTVLYRSAEGKFDRLRVGRRFGGQSRCPYSCIWLTGSGAFGQGSHRHDPDSICLRRRSRR
jgi:hypothetical protein